jgi:hypothetical protein
VEVYARATNANTLAWMPLWLIMDGAENDSRANKFIHQRELLRRAEADEIQGRAANRVLDRVLIWQRDDTVEWETLGDVFATLATNGHATQNQVDQFWAAIWKVKVIARNSVDEGDALPFYLQQVWRGPSEMWLMRELPRRGPPNWRMYTGNWALLHAMRTSTTLLEFVVDDTVARVQQFRDTGEPFTRDDRLGPLQVVYAQLESNHLSVGQARVLFFDMRAGRRFRFRVRGTLGSAFPTPDANLSWRHGRALGAFGQGDRVVSEWPFEHVQDVEVLPHGSAMPRMYDASLESWIKTSLKATYYDWSKHGSVQFTKIYGAADPPLDSPIAFRFFIRTPDGDFPAGTLALRRDLNYEGRRVEDEAAAVMKEISIEDVWLVLKGDAAASKSFPDVTSQWDGEEIVIPMIRYGTTHRVRPPPFGSSLLTNP